MTCEYWIGKVLEICGRDLREDLFGPRNTFDNQKQLQPGKRISELRFEAETCRVWSTIANNSTGVFGIVFMITNLKIIKKIFIV